MERSNVKLKTIALGQGAKGLRRQVERNRVVSRSSAFSRCRNLDVSTDSIPETCAETNEENPASGPSNRDVKASTVPESTSGVDKPTSNNRRILLDNWKKLKQEEKLRQQTQQKPAFKSGKVQHPINPWSMVQAVPPLNKGVRVKPQKKNSPFKVAVSQAVSRQGAMTRTMAKNDGSIAPGVVLKAVPKTSGFKAPKGIKPVVLTMPRTPKAAQSKKVTMPSIPNIQPKNKSIAPALKKTNVPPLKKLIVQPVNKPKPRELKKSNPAPKAFSSIASLPMALVRPVTVNAKLNRTVETIDEEPECDLNGTPSSPPPTSSPYVTVRRGNYSERKRSMFTPTVAMDVEKVDVIAAADPPVTAVLDRPTVEEPQEKGAVYFRNLLDAEIARLSALADEWEAIRSTLSEDVPEDVTSLIDLATGHTRLLIRSKFEQFRSLTKDCEAGVCVPPVRPVDLHGFWEMIYMQVEGLDRRYVKLGELRSNNWTEKLNPVQRKKKVAVAPAAKRAAPAKTARTGVRAMIEAARKKKMEADRIEAEKVEAKFNASLESLEGDPRMAEIKATPGNSSKRISLLQQVLSTGAAKRVAFNSPIIMKVTRNARSIGSPVASGDSTPHVVDKAGCTPFKAGPTSSKAGSTPFKAGSTPSKTPSTPFKAGSTPLKAGSTPFKAGSTPFKAGPTSSKARFTPFKTPSTPFKAGSTPFQTGSSSSKTGPTFTKAGSTPFKAGSTPSRAGSTPFKTGPTPSKSILKDSSFTSASSKRLTRKTVNFGGSLRKSLLAELEEPEVVVATAAVETFEMPPPPSVLPPTTSLNAPTASERPDAPSTASVRRPGRQSLFDRLGIKDKLKQRGKKKENDTDCFAVSEIADNLPKSKKRKSVPDDAENTPNKEQRRSRRSRSRTSVQKGSEVAHSPPKIVERLSLSTLVDADNTPNKRRRSHRQKTPSKAVHQAFETTDSPIAASKRQSLPALIDVEKSANKQPRSYRKTPHKAVQQVDRISLFGGMEVVDLATPPAPATGDLICFDTPIRRSTRLSRK